MQPIITYTATKHGRIKVDQNGQIILKIPRHQAKNEVFLQKMLSQTEKFLEKTIKKPTKTIEVKKENSLLLFGEYVENQNIKNEKIFFQEILLQKSLPLLQKYSQMLGMNYSKLIFGNYKTKWGSCAHDQKIALNIKLVHLPEKFLEYVIVHEVCHLKVKNHSPNFWKLVETLLPNYKEMRKELKQTTIKSSE